MSKRLLMILMVLTAFLLRGSAAIAVPFEGDSTLSLPRRAVLAQTGEYSFFDQSYRNPAARQFQLPFSISAVYVGYISDLNDKQTAATDGRGERKAEVGAATYLKYGSSTLWGHAFYDNGKQIGLKWNETSDASLLYPYLTADSVGGDMSLEHYRFMGGYADNRGRWSWGAEIGYLAGLYYRNVDPRPKNVTGLLSLSAGAGYRLTDGYNLSSGLMAQRYQQTGSILFVSETHEDKIYHTTGLGTHYVRFGGTGKNTKYSGWRFGGSLQLIPLRSNGFIASVALEGFQFEKVLTDLNRLPLVKVKDTDISAEAGYRHVSGRNMWMSGLTLYRHDRKGRENIFGDPSMSIYPQIGSLDKYEASTTRLGFKALWSLLMNGLPLLTVRPSVAFSQSKEKYTSPARSSNVDALDCALLLQSSFKVAKRLTAVATLDGGVRTVLTSSLKSDGVHLNDDEGLTKSWMSDFGYLSSDSGRLGANLSLIYPLSGKLALSLSGGYTHRFLPCSNSGNNWHVTAAVLF